MKKRGGLTVASAVKAILMAASGVAAVAHAKEAPSTEPLEEVTVTTTKYRPDDQTTATGLSMALIETPQSISIISTEMLELFDMRSAYDAMDMIPGASKSLNAYGQQALNIRGQRVSPRVNTINSPSPQFLDSYAIERLEVVRGPATVLYGITGAFGGEMNQILKRPTDDFQANFGVEGGDFDRRRVQADLSTPLSDSFKVRALGAYTSYGIPQDVADPPNNIDRLMLASAAYDFSENTGITVTAYEENKSFDPADGCPLAQTATRQLYIPTAIPVERWYCSDSEQPNVKVDSQFQLAELKHRFSNDWSMDFRVGHQKSTSDLHYVFGFGPAGSVRNRPWTDVIVYSYAWDLRNTVVTSSASLGGDFELFGRTNQFFAALQYQKSEGDKANYTTFGLGVMNMFDDGGKGIRPDGTAIPPIPADNFVGNLHSENQEAHASVQLLLNPWERWQILAGILAQQIDLSSANVRPGRTTIHGGLKQTEWVPRLGITYSLLADRGQVLTDAKAYFSYSEGVRPNVGIVGAGGVPLTDPQVMDAYEIGLKTNWLDVIDATLSVFQSSVTNIPTKIFGNVGGSGGTFSNVLGGENTYDGAELQLLGQIVPGWNIDLSYGYMKARIKSGEIPHKIAVANVPKQQASLFTSYEFSDGPLAGFLAGVGIVRNQDTPLLDNVSFIKNYDTHNQLPWSSTRVDFRVSYKLLEGSMQGLSLFGNVYNAFDARSWYNGVGTAAFSNSVGRPRTITVGMTYDF